MGCACISGSSKPKKAQMALKSPHPVKKAATPKLETSYHDAHSFTQMEGRIPSTPKQSSLQPVLIPENTERLKHFYDVQQPQTRVKLYEISKETEILSLEKASPTDWQRTILRSLSLSTATAGLSTTPSNTPNLAIKTAWDHRLLVDTAGRILSLPPRDWVQEQVSLYREQLRPASDMVTTARRKSMQLQEHFKWLVWSAAAFFYVSISSPNPNLEVDLQREFGSLYSQNTETSFASHPNSSTGTMSTLNFELPTISETWFQGFAFKGVYLKLAVETSREGKVVKAEGAAMERVGQLCQMAQEGLNFALLFPMAAVVAFGPFLLYASPVVPGGFVGKSTVHNLVIPCPNKEPFVIPKENLLQLFKPLDTSSDISSSGAPSMSLKPLFFLVNAHLLLPLESVPRYLLYLSCIGSEIKVMKLHKKDPILPTRISSLLKSEGKDPDMSKLRSHSVEKFGWRFDVHTDSLDAVRRPNRLASIIDGAIQGDAIVTASPKLAFSRLLHVIQGKHAVDARRSAIKKVVTILETTDCISTHLALAELIHRHGLGARHSWIILSKLKDERTTALVQTDLLARTVKKFLHYQCDTRGIRNMAEYKEVLVRICADLLYPVTAPKPVNDIILFLLFLSRLRIVKEASKLRSSNEKSFSRVIANNKKKMESFEFLLRHELIKDVYTSSVRSPGLFLNVRRMWTSEYLAKARLDSFSFLSHEPEVDVEGVAGLDMMFEGQYSLREAAYFSLIMHVEQELNIQRTGNSLHSSVHSRSYISEEDIELLNREEEKLPQHFELVLPAPLYAHDIVIQLKEQYELPSLVAINDSTALADTLFRDIVSVRGEESVVAELMLLGVTLTYFQEKDLNKCVQLLRKVSEVLSLCVVFPAELAIAYHLWQGIVCENTNLAEAEQHYVTALLLMTNLYGDPRGRGAAGVPWQLLAASKLSMIGRDEGRIHDAVLAEEHFDSVYISTKQYRKLSYTHGRWKHTNTRAEELSIKYPFEHWSTFTPNKLRGSCSFDDATAGDNWEGYFSCVLQNHLPMFQSGVMWSNVHYKHLLKSTKLQAGATQTFVDSLGREIRRPALQQSTLSQVLATETGVLTPADLKGVVYIWGSDSQGQLGLSVNEDQVNQDLRLPVPRMLTPLKDQVIKEIAVGADHCVAISIEGKCWSWGDNSKNQLGLGPDAPPMVPAPTLINTINPVIQGSCGYSHTLLLTHDYQVYSVGDAEKGILGHGNLNSVFHPKAIYALKNVKVKHVECGGFHSMALTSDGNLYSWGEAQGGQLGFHLDMIYKKMKEFGAEGPDMYLHTPTRLYGKLGNKRVIQVACGEAHTLALTQEGEVFCWGQNSNGQLGLGFSSEAYIPGKGDELSTRYEPELMKTLSHSIIKKIAASGVYSMFVSSENVVYACGANDFYKLGLEMSPGDSKDVAIPTKLDVFRGYSISEVSCGIDHALAIGTEPQKILWSWGKNRDGQLGVGTESAFASPRPVQSMSSASLYKAACGSSSSMVIVGNPTVTGRRRVAAKDDMELNWGLVLSE